MPQNHKTFLHLSEGSIAHLRPSLSAVCPLYFSFPSSLPPPVLALRQLNPPPFHLPPAPSSVCVNPLSPPTPFHFFSSLSPHPSPFPPSPSRPFPSLIDMFPFSKARSLHHICPPLQFFICFLLSALTSRFPAFTSRPPFQTWLHFIYLFILTKA